MALKHIKIGTERGYVGDKPMYKAVPKVFIQPEWVTTYFLERDRIIYKTTKHQSTKDEILLRYGKTNSK